MDSILICCDKSPFGTNITSEALRLVAGFQGLGPTIPCIVVFDEDAVYFLMKNYDVTGLDVDSLDESRELLELVDAEVRVLESALNDRGLTKDDLIDYPNMKIINVRELAELISEQSSAFHM
jgi:sulfur relay (sulfurtransferase) DsrF/TusC family protein